MSATRNSRPQPKDHLKPAAEREVTQDETVDVEYNGQKFTIPASMEDWPAGALRHFENSRAVEGVRALVGGNRWDILGMDDWKGRDVNALFEEFAKAVGMETAGN